MPFVEFGRALLTFGYFFGLAPLVSLRALLARDGGPAAREICLRHAERARRLGGIKLEVEGRENIPADGGFVLVHNETSPAEFLTEWDVFWRQTGIDHILGAIEFRWVPFWSQAAGRCGYVFIRRGDRASSDRALDVLTSAARQGRRVGVAPEGRLSPDGTVGHFKRGAFLIAIRSGARILPVAIEGGPGVMRAGSARMRSGTIRYRVGPPIETAGLAEADAPALADRVRSIVAALQRGVSG